MGAGCPVVICCASADAETIKPVVAEIEAEGHAVALLASIESDLESLAPAVESFAGEGLYVLCRSKALGRRAVDELRDVLLAHHVPFGRTLTVASTRPKELRERIGASLRRLSASGTGAPADPARARTRLGMTAPKIPATIPATAPTPTSTPRLARKTQLGVPQSKPQGSASATTTVGPPPPPPRALIPKVPRPSAAKLAEPEPPGARARAARARAARARAARAGTGASGHARARHPARARPGRDRRQRPFDTAR